MRDLISLWEDEADNLLVYRNIEKVTAQGIEAQVEGKWENGWRWRISCAVQKALNQLNEELTNSPRILARLRMTVPLIANKLFSSAEVQHAGKRRTLIGNYAAEYFVTNLALYCHQLLPGWEATVNINNVFDKQYGVPGSEEHSQEVINQDGRGFRLRMSHVF